SAPKHLQIGKEHGLPIYEFQDLPIIQQLYVALIDKETVVVSIARANVVEALARAAGKSKANLDKDVMEMLGKIDNKQSLWLAAARGGELLKDLPNVPGLSNLRDKLRSFTLAVRVHDAVHLHATFQATEPKSATTIYQVLVAAKAGLGLVGLRNKDFGHMLSDFLEEIDIDLDKPFVHVKA